MKIYVDGASQGNEQKDPLKRKGGFAFVVETKSGHYVKGEPYKGSDCSNNLMELKAMNAALSYSLKAPLEAKEIEVITDSQYVDVSIKGREERTIVGNTVYLKTGKPACNSLEIIRLFENLDKLKAAGKTLIVSKCKGHVGIPGNEAANDAATEAAASGRVVERVVEKVVEKGC